MRALMKGRRGGKPSSSPDLPSVIPLSSIDKVTFFKRDEIVTDLICCEVVVADKIWTLHEDMKGWDAVMVHLAGLPGFREDWIETVSQPPFALCETVAFKR